MITLGKKVKDTVSNFKGTVVSRHEYLDGSVQFGIQAVVLEDGKLPDIKYFDEKRLEDLPTEWQRIDTCFDHASVW
jgi:hypothetical protein